MRKTRVAILAGALVIVANAVALTGVLYNRSGAPEATLVLTERELPLHSLHRESTGVMLRLRWSAPLQDPDLFPSQGTVPVRAEWFDQDKLEALGFDCSVDLDHPGAEQFYRKALPMEAYVVLEQDGEAWREHLSRLEERTLSKAREGDGEIEERLGGAIEAVRRAERTHSRLFAVDAGSDPLELRERYPDRSRFIVARAVVDLLYVGKPYIDDGTARWPRLRGRILRLTVGDIHVPAGLAAPLSALLERDAGTPPLSGVRGEEDGAPRYEATLRYGRRLEPWVESIRLIEPGP